MENLREMLPHSRPESKMSKQDHVSEINEVKIQHSSGIILSLKIASLYEGPDFEFIISDLRSEKLQ